MRRDFLLKELDEKEWFKRLKGIEKARERNTEIRQVLELFKDVSRDILLNIQEIMNRIIIISNFGSIPNHVLINGEEIQPTNYVLEQVKELDKFTDYCNSKFLKFENLFKNKAPRISHDWEVRRCMRI